MPPERCGTPVTGKNVPLDGRRSRQTDNESPHLPPGTPGKGLDEGTGLVVAPGIDKATGGSCRDTAVSKPAAEWRDQAASVNRTTEQALQARRYCIGGNNSKLADGSKAVTAVVRNSRRGC